MKKEVYELIKNNVPLRRCIASYLNTTDASVYSNAKRNAQRLNDYIVVKMIMHHTGLKESEIFPQKSLKAIKREN